MNSRHNEISILKVKPFDKALLSNTEGLRVNGIIRASLDYKASPNRIIYFSDFNTSALTSPSFFLVYSTRTGR